MILYIMNYSHFCHFFFSFHLLLRRRSSIDFYTVFAVPRYVAEKKKHFFFKTKQTNNSYYRCLDAKKPIELRTVFHC